MNPQIESTITKSGVNRISNTNNEDLISADKVKVYVDGFNEVNSDFEITVARDRSIPLVQRTQLLFKNAWQGILLVMVFLSFFFVQDWLFGLLLDCLLRFLVCLCWQGILI